MKTIKLNGVTFFVESSGDALARVERLWRENRQIPLNHLYQQEFQRLVGSSGPALVEDNQRSGDGQTAAVPKLI